MGILPNHLFDGNGDDIGTTTQDAVGQSTFSGVTFYTVSTDHGPTIKLDGVTPGSVTVTPASDTSDPTKASLAGGPNYANDQSGEITFIAGVDAGKVANPSYWTWNGNTPATYSNTGTYEHKWGSTTIGAAGGNVTYWFDAASNWTTAEKNALISGLQLWQSEANISFSEAASAGTANFIFYRGNDGGAHENNNVTNATVGSTTDPNPTGTFISIDTSVGGFGPIGGAFNAYGNYTYQTLVHEEGHMIGLGHAGPYNGNVNPATQQYGAFDTRLWSVMSYIDPFNTNAQYFNQYTVTGTSWGTTLTNGLFYNNEPSTPMMLDILAAQRLYGAPTSGQLTTAQTFGFHTTITGLMSRYFDFNVDVSPIITIYDTASNNTLDLSGWSADAKINLNPGTFSSANGMVNNIGVAFGTSVNNAVGGSGNDLIIVNPSLIGTLTGGGGNDTFQNTLFGLSSYTVTDMNFGDKLNFTDAALGTFSYTRSGTTLTYGGGFTMTLSNNAIGHFVVSTDATYGGVDMKLTQPTAMSDFSDDGKSDVLWRNANGTLADWSMNGAAITNSALIGASPDASWSIADIADFNGDGHSDVLWRNTGGTLVDWTMNGASITNSKVLAAAPDASWSIAGVGDLNGDHAADILWRNSNGTLADWTMNGGTIVNSQLINAAPDASWSVAGMGDFNGDGRSDILWRNTSGTLADWSMNGASISGSQVLAAAPDASWSIAGIGDFNGNGNSDILWRNSNGTLAEWMMTGGTIASSQAIAAAPDATWSIVEIGDFDGNGRSDILWRQSTTGALAEWQMNGGTIASSQLVQAAPDANWHTQARPTISVV